MTFLMLWATLADADLPWFVWIGAMICDTTLIITGMLTGVIHG